MYNEDMQKWQEWIESAKARHRQLRSYRTMSLVITLFCVLLFWCGLGAKSDALICIGCLGTFIGSLFTWDNHSKLRDLERRTERLARLFRQAAADAQARLDALHRQYPDPAERDGD